MDQAVLVRSAADLGVVEVPTETVGPGQVAVAVEYGGVCGSDLHYAAHGRSGAYHLTEPLILGHEIAGRVAETGAGVTGLAVGQPVTVHPASTCGRCQHCRAGRSNLCHELRYLGSAARTPHTQGGFRTRLVVAASQVRPVPAHLELRRAVLAEPLGVVLHALRRAGEIEGRRVHITGAGPIGALAAACCVRAAATSVSVSDPSDGARAIAARMGAQQTYDAGAGPDAIDLGIEASGAPAALLDLVGRLAPGGTLLVVANFGRPVELPLGAMAAKEITLVTSLRFADEITEAIALLADGLDVDPLITHELPVAEAATAFRTANDRSTGSSKVLLRFPGAVERP